MQSHTVSYVPGPWVLLAGRGTVVLADLDPAGPVLTALWDAIERDAGVDGLLGVIVREGLRSVPSFAITDGVRVLVSGKSRAEITATEGGGLHVLSAADAPTWSDRQFPQADEVRLSAEGVPADGPSFALRAGVTHAAAVTVGAPSAVGEPAPPPAPEPALQGAPAPADGPGPPPQTVRSTEPEAPQPSFDHLFGNTDNSPSAPTTGETAATMYPPPRDDTEAATAGTALIERLPWELSPEFELAPQAEAAPLPSRAHTAEPQPTVPPPRPAPSDSTEWHTVDRSRLSHPGDPALPMVLAAVCPNRHVGPPQAGVCRVCGQPVPQQDPVRVPRPVLGVIKLSTGDMVPLDRDIVLGRAPSVPDSEPSIRPHLVQLAGTAAGISDISRSHLRISLEGWHVQAVDLGSTNGTIVTLPNQQPVRLRAHDPFTIVPGTVVILADEVTLRYEVTG